MHRTEGTQQEHSALNLLVSPQDANLVIFQEPPEVNVTEMPPFTFNTKILDWAATKGHLVSVASLDDPSSILLRLGQGQLPQRPLVPLAQASVSGTKGPRWYVLCPVTCSSSAILVP